jgi:subtilisin family serine protease
MAEPMRVIVELSYSKRLRDSSIGGGAGAPPSLDTRSVPKLEGLTLDESYAPVELPRLVPRDESGDPHDVSPPLAIDEDPETATYLVRGTVADEAALTALRQSASANTKVVQVFSDVAIQPTIICPGSPALGTDADVEALLCTRRMRECKMDGSGVLVAVVDTGINIEYLLGRGKRPNFDAARSWAWNPATVTPGQVAVDHGTMCAFDVCIAAPNCTLLDIALLHPLFAPPGGSLMSGILSDAVRAYRHLLNIQLAPRRPGEGHSMVVTNSWGMFHPSWDFPVGDPGNYSDNPNHPFNRIVASLERAGADILFAAGNCGADCPDGRCQGVTNMAIYGANSHPQVLSVAGVDTTKMRVGYSAIGPGRLARMKPDISGYTHFRGSGVYPADGGTSAATPVVAGVVAAVRSIFPYDPTAPASAPAAVRNMLTKTAEDRGLVGYDFEYGWGIVNGCGLADSLCKKEPEKEKPCPCCCCWHDDWDDDDECGRGSKADDRQDEKDDCGCGHHDHHGHHHDGHRHHHPHHGHHCCCCTPAREEQPDPSRPWPVP